MIIVVTGPAYSGRISMANTLLKHVEAAESIPVITTSLPWIPDDTNAYSIVSEEEFNGLVDAGAFAARTRIANGMFGVLMSDLEKAKTGSYVLSCDSQTAVELSHILLRLEVPSSCVYMHCSVRTMLFRRAAERRASSDFDLDLVHDVYGDHSLKYSILVKESEMGTGYGKVIPVNSDRMSERSYIKDVVLPLAPRLSA